MKPRKAKAIRSVLEKKGFVAENRHHIFLFLHIDGRRSSIRTRISHGISEYGTDLQNLMAKQLHLTNRELNDFLDCPMTEEMYIATLAERGVI